MRITNRSTGACPFRFAPGAGTGYLNRYTPSFVSLDCVIKL